MKKKVVLAVGAHPDDIDFGAGGTIAKFCAEGTDCHYLICTDGSRGSSDPKMTHKKLAQIRKREQIEAGKVLGVKRIFFLEHTDTQLISDFNLKKDIAKIIKQVKPDIILTIDPTFYYSAEFNFINHTDHRAVGVATIDACFPLSRDRLTFPDHEEKGLRPHATSEIWLLGFEKRNMTIDITSTFAKKLEALSKHKSQYENFSDIKRMVGKWARHFGSKKGIKYAEGFTRIKLS